MLVGYVSDERYLALHDALLEFEGPDGSVDRPVPDLTVASVLSAGKPSHAR